jgi:shikimate kinase
MSVIYLCGLSGAGKSTSGRALAIRLHAPFYDLDEVIAEHAGAKVAEIFAREGEAGFRAREAQAVRWAAELADGVVALGGGAVCDPENLSVLLQAGRLVWLDATTEVLVGRVGDTSARPLLAHDPAAALERLRAARRGFYERAQLRIDTSQLTPDDVAERIADWLRP